MERRPIVAFPADPRDRGGRESKMRRGAYLCSPVLRGALGIRQLALPALAPIEPVVAAGLGAAGHQRAAADGGIDVLVVRARAALAGHIAVAVRRVV